MDPLRIIAARCGFFTRQDALGAGYASREITWLVRHGEWTRIRRGIYVFTADWRPLDPVEKHRVRARAVMASLGSAVALSHVSGMIVHGIDVWGIPLERVHVTRLDGGPGRLEGDVVHHEGFCTDDEIVTIDGLQVLRPERCVLETASRSTAEAALCLLDAGLRSEHFDQDALSDAYRILEHWPFMHRVSQLVPLADGRSGSIGESRGRHLFRAFGLPPPHLQFDVRRSDGSLIGTADWGWPDHGLLGEFDGRVKYGRLLRPGEDPGDAIFREKVREDEMREITGYAMVRLVWADYDHPHEPAQRVRRHLRRLG